MLQVLNLFRVFVLGVLNFLLKLVLEVNLRALNSVLVPLHLVLKVSLLFLVLGLQRVEAVLRLGLGPLNF